MGLSIGAMHGWDFCCANFLALICPKNMHFPVFWSQRTLSSFLEPNFTTLVLFSSALTLAMHITITIVLEQRAGAALHVDTHALKPLESGVKLLCANAGLLTAMARKKVMLTKL